jgi:hypothetical protein
MKKEIAFVVAALLFVLAYALDYIAGPVRIAVKDPVMFLTKDQLSIIPLTAVAIGVRTIAIFITTILALSFIEKKFFTKAFIVFFLGGIAELYAIQQMATGGRVTPMQWTLSFAYAGGFLLVSIVFYVIAGIFNAINQGLSGGKKTKSYPKPILSDEDDDDSASDD